MYFAHCFLYLSCGNYFDLLDFEIKAYNKMGCG